MVLYEDIYLIAVNKPNNMLVHHSKMANNARDEKTLV
jgi:tRNA pseudouridine65 synthase